MKKIEAIIRTSKFEEVKEALAEKHVNFFTFYEVKGYGHQKGKTTTYRGAIYDVGYIGRRQDQLLSILNKQSYKLINFLNFKS